MINAKVVVADSKNENFIFPKVYFVGATSLNLEEVTNYLTDTDQLEFADEITQESSKIALDLKPSQWAEIERFFDSDNNKFLFSKRYAEAINDDYAVPSWIDEIKGWLS